MWHLRLCLDIAIKTGLHCFNALMFTLRSYKKKPLETFSKKIQTNKK